MHGCTTTLQSSQRALTIRLRLFVGEHDSTLISYTELGVTQLKILAGNGYRIKLFGEEHERT